jgi:hypothetical protein
MPTVDDIGRSNRNQSRSKAVPALGVTAVRRCFPDLHDMPSSSRRAPLRLNPLGLCAFSVRSVVYSSPLRPTESNL